jgi:hypothetical protein
VAVAELMVLLRGLEVHTPETVAVMEALAEAPLVVLVVEALAVAAQVAILVRAARGEPQVLLAHLGQVAAVAVAVGGVTHPQAAVAVSDCLAKDQAVVAAQHRVPAFTSGVGEAQVV